MLHATAHELRHAAPRTSATPNARYAKRTYTRRVNEQAGNGARTADEEQDVGKEACTHGILKKLASQRAHSRHKSRNK